jgi:hypothetical protein
LKTSAPRNLVGGVLLVGVWLGTTAHLHAADSHVPAGTSETRDRGASLVGTLDEAFPALGPQLRLSSSFEKTTWSQGEDRIRSLRPRRAASPGAARTDAPVDVVFPVRASDPVVAEGDGIRVVLRPRGAASTPARILDGKLAYLDVYEETDSIHIIEERSTEEYLYLRSAKAPVRFAYDLVEARGVSRIEVEHGQVSFLDDDDEGLVILAPFVVDAAGRHSATAARWELEDETGPGARRLVLRLDPVGLDYPLVVDPTWIRTRDLLPARQDGVGILLHNNKVLVMGGSPQAALYDVATGTWSPTGPGWPGRSYYAAVMLRDGRVLATGGSDPNPFADCHLYDPDSNTWTPADNMNEARAGHTATLLGDGTVLVAGGEGTLLTTEIYDPAGDTWTYTGNLNNGKARHTATKLLDGRVVVAGGVTGVSLVTDITEIYSAGTWTEVNPMGTLRSRHSATLLRDGTILVAGGGPFLDTAEIYDPAGNLWTPTANLSFAREEHSATMLPSGNVLVAGGDSFGELITAEIYDPAGPSWVTVPVPDMNFARRRHAATMLPDGRVLVVGGFGPGALVTAELLDVDVPVFVDHNAMASVRSEFTMTPLADGRVLAAGGANALPSPREAEIYNPGTGAWVPAGTPMNQPRWRHSATRMFGGRVLMAGSAASIAAGRSAEVYEPGDTWTVLPDMSIDRYWHTATLLPCGEVLVVGGRTIGGANPTLVSAERFNPRRGTWAPTGPLGTRRQRHTATLLPDGKVLVTGGWNLADGPLLSADIYDPVGGTWAGTGDSRPSCTTPAPGPSPRPPISSRPGTPTSPPPSCGTGGSSSPGVPRARASPRSTTRRRICGSRCRTSRPDEAGTRPRCCPTATSCSPAGSPRDRPRPSSTSTWVEESCRRGVRPWPRSRIRWSRATLSSPSGPALLASAKGRPASATCTPPPTTPSSSCTGSTTTPSGGYRWPRTGSGGPPTSPRTRTRQTGSPPAQPGAASSRTASPAIRPLSTSSAFPRP